MPKATIMRIDPEVEDAVDQALHLIEAGRESEGESRILRLYAENPDLSCTQYAMGVLCLQRDDFEQGAIYFEQAVKTDPFFAEAHFNLSCCYKNMLLLDKALRSLREARDTASVGGIVYQRANEMLKEFEDDILREEGVDLDTFIESIDIFNHGFEAMEKGDLHQAIIDFEKCIRLRPKGVQAYGNLGICYGKLGMMDKANAMFDKALEIDPDYEPAKWNRKALLAHARGEELETASIDYAACRYLEEEEEDEDEAPLRGWKRWVGGPDLLRKLRALFSDD